ncbi:hypothetical protein [Microbacterium jejuense]|uniref:hypothetical protein n=1 Tax=Microbacterium jejuense TaxID=1263637 RepID=UPI0031E6750E
MTSEGTGSDRVSAIYGIVSVIAAAASLLVPAALVPIWLSIATTGADDPRWSATVTVSNYVGLGLAWTIAAAAIVFGVISIRRAGPRARRPGRSRAIALGWVGIGVASVLSYVYFLGLGT